MAAPTFVGASTGVVVTAATATAVTCDVAGQAAGDLFIIQHLQDGLGTIATSTAQAGMSDLAGTTSAQTVISTAAAVGSPQAATQRLRIGRLNGGSPATITITSSGGDDIYARFYVFRGVATGSALTDVIENGSAGAVTTGSGTAAAITDAAVTTLGADRLALQFVGVDDDNPVDAFTGMSGGTWAEAVAEFASATGTDGCIQLQTAAMASAGTIDGGSYTMAASDNWGVHGFALIPASSSSTYTKAGYAREAA